MTADQSDLFEDKRDQYLEILSPLFFPRDPLSHDIIRFFSSVLRVAGMEDKGWDPQLESRAVLNDKNLLMKLDLSIADFPDGLTTWRLGLLLYSHILEMSAPYEVIANLLRFRIGEGFSPNPFYKYMNDDERKRFKKSGLFPKQKIGIIKMLSEKAQLPVGDIFDEFVDFDLRNAISHSDFVIVDEDFRIRGHSLSKYKSIPLIDLDYKITAAKAFASAFFIAEREMRKTWGMNAGRAIPYDPHYKALMEVLANEEGLMIGFKVHWPNGEDSYYRRTQEGVEMVNCFLSLEKETVELFVGMYAINPGTFSPLVEHNALAVYSVLEGSDESVVWDNSAATAKQKLLPEVNLGGRSNRPS